MRRRLALVLLVALASSGCGDPAPGPKAIPRSVDRTDPWDVAHAWVRAWCEGQGGHVDYAFEALPEPWSRKGSLPGDLPQGVPVASFTGTTMGVGGHDPETGFDLERYLVRIGPRVTQRISSHRAVALRYTIPVQLEDGRTFRPNVLVRPVGSLAGRVTVDEDTRWRVLGGGG